MSPETDCTFVSRATEPTWTSPDTVFTSSAPPTVSMWTSPLALLTKASDVESRATSPAAVLKSTLPYSPAARRSADFVRASIDAPLGQVMRSRMSGAPSRMSGPLLKEIQTPPRVRTATVTS